MQINIHEKSQDLLIRLANAIHDRETKVMPHPFCFHSGEIKTAVKWLEDFVKEIKEDCVCL